MRWLDTTLVDVDYIADRLECVERDAHRKNDVEWREVGSDHRVPVPKKEIGVFEISQYRERT